MKGKPFAALRSWLGIVAAAVVIVSAAWLTFEYVKAARAEAAEKALIESLKERARTDATVHQTLLQPEFDRQRDALLRRHRV
jgi:ABC-type nickel/cobalt efflux system permease component RcnA